MRYFHIDAETTDQSNDILMSFWSHFSESGLFYIQHSPKRDGANKYIRLAFVRSKRSDALYEIGYHYEKRHVISSMSIRACHNDVSCAEDDFDLVEMVFDARPLSKEYSHTHYILSLRDDLLLNPSRKDVQQDISLFKMGCYYGENYSIRRSVDGKVVLTVNVDAYNETHAAIERGVKVDYFKSIFSIMFNLGVNAVSAEVVDFDDVESCFMDGVMFNEYVKYRDIAPADGVLLYSEVFHDFIDGLMGDSVSGSVKQFMQACKLFDMSLIASMLDDVDVRMSNVYMSMLMSVLEAATLGRGDAGKCVSCRQMVYSISKRVTDFSRFYGGGFADVVRFYYQRRSEFLHQAYSAQSGNVYPAFVPQIHQSAYQDVIYAATRQEQLFEIVSYLLRQFCMNEIIPNRCYDWASGEEDA